MSENFPRRYSNEFLRCIVGSRLTGLNLDNGDTDLMGILIEDPQDITGLGNFEQHIYRTQPKDSPSQPGDIDFTCYGLQKFMRLAVKGNPTILQLLFVPIQFRVYDSIFANDLRALTPMVISRKAAGPFLGYLSSQKRRLSGEKNHRALPEGHAYDRKRCAHMVRLGFQGIELMISGHMTLPMREDERQYCLSIRRGELDLKEILEKTTLLENELSMLQTKSPLRKEPDLDIVNDFLHMAYQTSWTKGYSS